MSLNLRQLSKILELSPTTVSRALAGYPDVSPITRRRVQESAKEHGYHPSPVAQRLQKGKTEAIGIVLPPGQFKDTFFLELLAGISISLSKVNYDLTIAVASDETDEMDSLRRMVQGKRVDGMILTMTKAHDPRITYLIDLNFPFALYGRTKEKRAYAFLDMDGERAFNEACDYLIDLGHKRIAIVNGEPDFMFSHFCLEGYCNSLKKNNIEFRSELVRYWKHEDLVSSSYLQTIEIMNLPKPPTAIVFQTEASVGILKALQELKLEVGIDVSLIGYDDLEIAKTNNPPLTIMRPPTSNAGERLVSMLMDIINGHSGEKLQEILKADMVCRQSTGPAPKLS